MHNRKSVKKDTASDAKEHDVLRLQKGLEENAKVIQRLMARQDALAQNFTAHAARVAELQRLLADHVPRTSSEQNLEKEFNQMLSWQPVRGIRVTRDAVEVFTELIRLIDPGERKRYPIAEFKISICPLKIGFDLPYPSGISIVEHAWRGPWCYRPVVEGDVCFGGFLKGIMQCAGDCHFPGMLSLIFSFLTFEGSGPEERPEEERSKDPYHKPKEPFYRDRADRENECRRYVSLMQQWRHNSRDESLKRELRNARRLCAVKSGQLQKMRKRLQALRELSASLERRICDAENKTTEHSTR